MKLSKQESLSLLYSIRGLVKLGNPVEDAVSLLIEIESGRTEKALRLVHYLIKRKRVHVPEALRRAGIINSIEESILGHATDTVKSLSDIIETREMASRFTKTLVSLVWFPYISVFVGLALAKWLLPTFLEPINRITKIAEIRTGLEMDPFESIPDMFWYVRHIEAIVPVGIGWLLVGLFAVTTYTYLSHYKPWIVYRIFRAKSYDDLPVLLMLMNSLNEAGLPPITIAKILREGEIKPGWSPLFRNMERAIKDGRPVYKEFEKFGFPRDVVLIVKSSEISKDFWENVKDLIVYAKDKNAETNKAIKTYFGGMSTIVAYSVIIYFLVGVFLLLMQMQSLTTALM